jgi:triosephosphate isomerase
MPETRTPLIAANWKMNKTVAEAGAFFDDLLERVGEPAAEIVVCPPYTALAAAVERTREAPVRIASQNVHFEAAGAFTGEVSIPMLAELGVEGAIVGHSERRQLFGETDEALARKVPALLEAGLLAILCVGETEAERDGGATEDVIRRQLEADLAEVDAAGLARLVIAYEPIWAIGTGRTATPEQAQEACAFVRSLVGARDEAAGAAVRVLYGGSMKPANAAELLAQPDIDGGLIGGAALDAADFAAICEAAAQ